jgi:hypothetical protein
VIIADRSRRTNARSRISAALDRALAEKVAELAPVIRDRVRLVADES